MQNSRKILLLVGFTLAALEVFSQNIYTYSPYSRFGIGIIPTHGFSQTRAMGGVSQSVRSPYMINYLNPASYAAQDSMSFTFDFGLESNNSSFSGYDQYLNKVSASSSAGGIHHIAIAFPVSKKIGMAAGIAPYSSVGYRLIRFETDPYILSTIGRIKYEHAGKGGINQLFVGAGYAPFKNFSIGANFIYYFGSLDYNNNIIFPSSSYSNTNASVGSSIMVSDVSFNVGFQYRLFLDEDKNNSLGFGVTVDAGSDINMKYKWLTKLEGSTYVDSLIPHPQSKSKFKLPTGVNSGISYTFKDKLFATAEYYYQDWTKTEAFNTTLQMGKMEAFRLGVEFTPNRSDLKSYLKKISYRAGGFYNKTNLIINSRQIEEYGISLGFGLPFRNNTSFNLSAELGRRGTNENYLIKESFFVLNLGITFHDSPWFFKRKYY